MGKSPGCCIARCLGVGLVSSEGSDLGDRLRRLLLLVHNTSVWA